MSSSPSSDRVVAPFGAWTSPLGPDRAASGATRFSGVALTRDDGGDPTVWWAESRPSESGRVALVAAQPGGPPADAVGDWVRLRSRVNEYGGGAFWCGTRSVDWVDDSSQRIQRAERRGGVAAVPVGRPLTPPPPAPLAWRYAAGRSVAEDQWLVVERESHHDDRGRPLATPLNDLVALRSADQRQWVLVTAGQPGGGDFVAAPAVSPDGTAVAWLTWNHPDMPWDAAELWVGRLVLDAQDPAVTDRRRVAGGRAGGAAHSLDRAVSVCLPEWSPDGRLWWCDDADGWWHLRAAAAPGLPDAAAGDDPATAVPGGGEPGEELGEPRWVAGGRRYGFTDDGSVVITVSSAGVDSLWSLDPATGERTALPGPALTSVEYVAVDATSVAVIGSTAETPATVWLLDLSVHAESVAADAPAAAVDLRPVAPPLGPEWVSTPIAVTFPTGRDALAGTVPDVVDDDGEAVAHALVYLPRSGDHQGPPDELPPLVVRIHGGPTAAARPEFSTSVQFWTTRGFAVADVNYRGSTGFGRDFRDQLQGRWGVVDVEDCIAVTRYLAGGGLVDGERCVIRGGSAGGFTALAAVCFQRDWGADGAFAGACSLYGVTDLAALAADTHKFESRYLDGLVAPLPAGAAVYRERSPLFHADRLSRPVLLLQGTEDKVVPPAQAEVLVDALTANGVPHRYLLFEGEGHGFHRAETIVAALRAELEFYGEVLGFEPD